MSEYFLSERDHSIWVGRRAFITSTIAGLTVTALASVRTPFLFEQSSKIKAIAFDAFALFDPRAIVKKVQIMFPDKGLELANIWRTKLFEYCWLKTIGNNYTDFWQIAEEALLFASNSVGIKLSVEEKTQLMKNYLELPLWPDVLPVLMKLGERGLRIAFLSNMTKEMLEANIKNSQAENYFDEVIGTDEIKNFKPNPNAYQLGPVHLGLKKEEILFVAFAGWDVAGAKWYGYPTFWLNRLEFLHEEISANPEGCGKTMEDLLRFLN